MDTLHAILIWIMLILLWIMLYLSIVIDKKNTIIWGKDLKNKLLGDKLKKGELESENLWNWMIKFRTECDLLADKLEQVENADKLKLIDELEKIKHYKYTHKVAMKKKHLAYWLLNREQKETYKNNLNELLWTK